MNYRPGQQVFAITHSTPDGKWSCLVPMFYVRAVKHGFVRLKDVRGEKLKLPARLVFPSIEAAEAYMKNLRMTVDARTGTITEFPE